MFLHPQVQRRVLAAILANPEHMQNGGVSWSGVIWHGISYRRTS